MGDRVSLTSSSSSGEKLIAATAVLLLPLAALMPFAGGVFSTGMLIGAALAPVIIKAGLRMSRFGGFVLAAYALSIVSAPLLLAMNGAGRGVDSGTAWGLALALTGSAISLFLVLWARTILTVPVICVLFALGVLLQAALTPERWEANPWKFGFAFPVVLMAFVFVDRAKSGAVFRAAVIATGCALIAISAVFGFRSYAGIVAVTIVFALLPAAPRLYSGRAAARALVGVTSAVLVYVGGVALALGGWLGERNMQVTRAQVAEGGSVLSAGRAESGAAFALFARHPLGLGPGVIPSSSDISIGQSGLVGRGVDIDGSYVRDYLFGSSIKLHSVLADLWLSFGIAGFTLGLLFAIVFVRSLLLGLSNQASVTPVAHQTASVGGAATGSFLAVLGLWDLAFSPIGTNLHEVVFAAALLFPVRRALSAEELSVAQAVSNSRHLSVT